MKEKKGKNITINKLFTFPSDFRLKKFTEFSRVLKKFPEISLLVDTLITYGYMSLNILPKIMLFNFSQW